MITSTIAALLPREPLIEVQSMLDKKEREKLNNFLQSIATLAVQAQSEDGEDLANTLDYIRGDLNQCDSVLETHDYNLTREKDC
jgi:ABC-type transporter Mla subunit MlaD